MNVLCPLDDDCLPLEAANLKTRQVRTSRQPAVPALAGQSEEYSARAAGLQGAVAALAHMRSVQQLVGIRG